MTDLTEYKWYYCKMKDGDIQMLERGSDYFLSGDVPLLNNEVKEVLAPVPSYEEWEQLQNWADFTNDYYELREKIEIAEYENAQLKEQINKCYLDAINRGTANTVKAVKEFGMPERIEELVKQNAQLKELLKECELWFTGIVGNMNNKNVGEHNRNLPIGNFEYIFKVFSQKIDEVLK